MVCLSRPYPFKFFKGCLPQILLGPLLNTLSQIKKNLAANLESVAQRNSNDVDHTQLEEFHELLTEYMDILMKNGLKTKDFTYHNLKGMLKNKNLVALIEDQD